MGKITSFTEAVKIAKEQKLLGKKVCLATGCFDVLHIGHVRLFQFAKKYCDFLIVGLENDKTIRLSKGKGRPIFTFKDRSAVLSELKSIDLIFKIEAVIKFGTKEANGPHAIIAGLLKPDYIVTNPCSDKFWKEKRKGAKEIGAKLLLWKEKQTSSTTLIASKLQSEL